MSDGNNELILEIIDIFVVQAEEIWTQMDELLVKKDYDSLGKLAHKAKSSVAIMGMQKMALELKEFELNCQDQINIESFESKIINFKSECLQVIQELEEYKKTLTTS